MVAALVVAALVVAALEAAALEAAATWVAQRWPRLEVSENESLIESEAPTARLVAAKSTGTNTSMSHLFAIRAVAMESSQVKHVEAVQHSLDDSVTSGGIITIHRIVIHVLRAAGEVSRPVQVTVRRALLAEIHGLEHPIPCTIQAAIHYSISRRQVLALFMKQPRDFNRYPLRTRMPCIAMGHQADSRLDPA